MYQLTDAICSMSTELLSIAINTHYIATVGQGKLYAMAKPSADHLEQDIAHLKSTGIDLIVSLLEDAEAHNLNLQAEATACQSHGLHYSHFPIADFGTPDSTLLGNFVEHLHRQISNGCNAVIHCRGGIGRSGLLCCCILIKHGLSAKDAIAMVSLQRGCSVPETPQQIACISNYEQSLQ